MRPDGVGEREHGIADLLLILAAVCAALATWSSLSNISGVPAWRSCTSVAVTLLLALAGTTRNPRWAVSIRFVTGVWLISAPFVLKFQYVTPAFWSYVVSGVLVMTLAAPGLANLYPWRVPARCPDQTAAVPQESAV